MKTKRLFNFKNHLAIVTVIIALLLSAQVFAATRYSIATGNWNQTSTWSASSGGSGGASVPVTGDAVIIEGGYTVTVTANAGCATVTFPTATTTPSTLTLNPGITLTVSGAISITRTTYGYNPNTIAVGSGNLNAGSIVFTNGGSVNRHQVTISSGTVVVTGNVTQSSSTGSATFSFTGAGLLKLGGAFLTSATGTLTLGSGCTVEYYASAAQTVGDFTYNNLTLSGSGAKTLSGATINGVLSMEGTAEAAGTVPTFGADATLQYKGSSAQTTGMEFPKPFDGTGGLIINNSSGVILSDDATINSKITFTAGKITTGSYVLSLGLAATVSGAGTGKYVNGNFLWKIPNSGSPSRTFDIGDATIYTPVQVDLHSMSGTAGTLKGSTTAGDHAAIGYSGINPNKSVNRIWTFVASGMTFTDYDATFNFVAGDVDAGANTANFIIKKFNSPSWSSPSLNGAANPLNTKATGFSSFGDFQAGEGTTLFYQIFTNTGTFTPPSGISSVDVECWGGGGAGGGCATGSSAAGGGGAGGAYVKSTAIPVTPGSAYTVTVGSAATGATNTLVNGNPSWFGTTATIYAQGGNGGSPATSSIINGAGGTGSTGSSIGSTKYKGGNGTTGNSTTGSPGGAGGGGAGSTGVGGNASAGTGGTGTSQNGGNGANGVGNATPGAAGSNYGGGGSGGKATEGKSIACNDQAGGNGAQGLVKISYTYPVYCLTGVSASAVCSNNAGSLVTLSSTATALPAGTYTVTYDLSAPNAATGLSSSMIVTAAGTGTFTTATLANPGSTTITITYIASVYSGNAISANNTAVITVLQAVNYGTVASADETICINGDPSNIVLSAAPSGGSGTFTYQWYCQNGLVTCPSGTSTSGWTIISGATSSSYNPPSGLTASRTYAVLVDAAGTPDCGSATWANNCRKVTVLPLPVPTLTGPSSACLNVAGNIYTTESGMSSYVWTVTGGTITAGGTSTSNTATVTWTSTGAKSISVKYTNANGCTAACATVYNITVNALPIPTINCAATVCQYSAGNVYTTESGMTNYIWTVVGGTITAGGTSTSNTATVTWTVVGTQSISVNYTNSNGCTAATPTVKNVTVNPLPVPTITGPTPVCISSTGNVYTTETGKNNYLWTISSGGTITAGGGTGNNTVTVTWNTAGARTVSVNYTDANGCTAASPTVKNVTVIPLPVPTLTGPSTACLNVPGNVYTTESGMSSYIWTVTGGTITAGGTSTSNTATVTWTTTGAKSISVKYTNASGCTAATATIYNVTVNALPIPTINCAATVCQNSAGNVYTTESGMTNYAWTVVGGTITAGGTSTSNSATVTWTVVGTQSISVNYTNSNGCTAATPTVKYVTVNPLPVPTITGPTPVCINSTGNVYTTETGKTNYLWTVSSGGTITAGGGTGNNTVTVTWNTAGARTVSVNYTDANGCTALTPTVYNVTVNPAVNYGTVASADETIYINGDPSNITMSTPPSGGAGTFTYQWYYKIGLADCPAGTSTAGWTIITGATGSSYDPPPGLTASRTYAVFVDATGSPDCGVATWATNCRKVMVVDLTIAGTVFDDVNGLTDNIVNGTGTNASGSIYMNLVNNTTNLVVASILVNSNGTYSFGTSNGVLINTGYKLIVTTAIQIPGNSLSTATWPPNWVSTGENLGAGAGNDGTVNGILPVSVVTTSLTNANFGLDQLPSGADYTAASQLNPGGSNTVIIPSAAFTGTDPEDGTYPAGLAGRKVTLAPATNGDLYYNGVAVSSVTTITSFNPALAMADPANGTLSLIFNYAVWDNANQPDPSPNTITMPFIGPPVADNDEDLGNIPGDNVTLNILSNDHLGNGSPALPADVTVDIDLVNPGTQAILVVPGQGAWTYDPMTGNLTFDPNPGFTTDPTPILYNLTEKSTGLSDPATVTVTYNEVPPVAEDDNSSGNIPGNNAVLNILSNDKLGDGSPATPGAVTADLDIVTPGVQTVFIAAGQGTWTYNPGTGLVTFTPQPGFMNDPSPVVYILIEIATGLSDNANVTIDYLPFNTDPDINATFINVPVPGDVHTNDDVPAGTSYGTPSLTSSPLGSTASITLNPAGTYVFTGDLPGIYVYSVVVCPPGPVILCPVETLTITVIAPYIYPPVAQTDVAITLQGIPVTLNTLANDVAGNTGGVLIPSSVTIYSGTPNPVTVGSLSVNPLTGDITFTPVPSFTGVVIYTYQVCDNTLPTALCTTAIQKVTVLPAGSPNVTEAADDYNVTPQGVTLTVAAAAGVLVNDNDPEGNAHAVTTLLPITVPGKGTVTFAADGSYVFVPVPVFRGGVNFPYTVCDNGSPVACASATLYIIVTSFNTDPDINATYVNVPVPGDVHTNDDVIENTTYDNPVLTSSPAGSSPFITMDLDGKYVFTGDQPGIYVYNVTVCAPLTPPPPCPTQMLTITVIAPMTNTNPPVANTDIAFSMGQPVTLHTLANDAAGNPGMVLVPSSVAIVPGTGPNPLTEGTVSVNPLTGDIIFTPVPNFAGVVIYSYTVCDNCLPTALHATALQQITVLLSSTTEAADDFNMTPQGVTLTVPASSGVLSNDTDPESDVQTVTTTSPMTVPGKGTVTIAADGSYVFVPVPGFTGPVSFVYTIVDSGIPPSYASATLYILVAPFNTDPDINETFVDIPVPGDVSTNDEMPAGTIYGTPVLASGPAGSLPVITLNSDGNYVFTTDVPGVYVYHVPVCPPGLPCSNETLTITVLDCPCCPDDNNNPPIANTDLAITMQNVPVTLNTLANDASGNLGRIMVPSTVIIVPGTAPNPVTVGSVSVNPLTGATTFTPVASFTGMVSYSYQVCDNSEPILCATAIQQISVIPAVNTNSTDAADDYNATLQGVTLTVPPGGGVLANDMDPEGNGHSVTTTSPMTVPGKGTVTIAANGSYVFVPVPGFIGPVEFVYTVCDNGTPVACANATLHILVRQIPVPDITPNITVEPNIMHGIFSFDIIIKVTELNNAPTNGLITILIPKDTRWVMPGGYDNTATMIGNNQVDNADWSFSSDATYYRFTSTLTIPALNTTQFGFQARWNAGYTIGNYTITSQITSFSGGENRIDNNVDAEKLDYFIY